MTNELQEFLRTRRSIRRFLPTPIPEAVLNRILETATFAPSAHDRQPWRFVVLNTAAPKLKLSQAVTDKFRLDMTRAGTSEEEIRLRIDRTIQRTTEAPTIVILCMDRKSLNDQPDEASRQAEITMARQSVAAAGLQLLLATPAEGLGGTWICWPLFAPSGVSSALDLPPDWDPQGMIFLGFADETPAAHERKSIKEVVKYL